MSKINYYPGHMAKTKRQIKERLKVIDIVIELVDARSPKASMNPELDGIIGNKPKLVLFNKSDLADQKGIEAWSEYFNNQDIHTLKINALSGRNINKIVPLSREILYEQFEKEKKKGRKKRPIRALIVGIPNVGKSTLINRLVEKKAVKVGDTPGITRHLQVIRIHDDMELLDTPGILWPDLDDQSVAFRLALIGTIKDHLVPKDDIVIFGFDILRKYYKKAFESRYDMTIESGDEALDIFEKIAQRRGALTKGGIVDYERVIDLFLYDLRHQQFGPIMLEWPEN